MSSKIIYECNTSHTKLEHPLRLTFNFILVLRLGLVKVSQPNASVAGKSIAGIFLFIIKSTVSFACVIFNENNEATAVDTDDIWCE